MVAALGIVYVAFNDLLEELLLGASLKWLVTHQDSEEQDSCSPDIYRCTVIVHLLAHLR